MLHKFRYTRKVDPHFQLVKVGNLYLEQRTTACGEILLEDKIARKWEDTTCEECWKNRRWVAGPNGYGSTPYKYVEREKRMANGKE